MKRILITGADSYIGTSLEQWLAKHKHSYHVDTVDTKSSTWKNFDFSIYDAIFHVAGIAHADTGRISETEKERYYRVNCDLAYAVAQKAKDERVSQFIFMSSISVYGGDGRKRYFITDNTIPKPSNFYGDSKLQAEKKLRELEDEIFQIAILRPPMIYGKKSKGNYPILSKIAQRALFFPKINNLRSMLHVDNLCEFIRLLIDNQERGIFFPQNEEYVQTSEMVRLIAKMNGKRIILVPGLSWLIFLLWNIPGRVGKLTSKAFGSMQYDMRMSEYKVNYRINNFVESIRRTER